jgi:hypothetical protein
MPELHTAPRGRASSADAPIATAEPRGRPLADLYEQTRQRIVGLLHDTTPSRTWWDFVPTYAEWNQVGAASAIDAALLTSARLPPTGVPPLGSLTAGLFELLRALTGRRSAEQIRRLDWTVDPHAYLPLFGLPPFTARDTDLVE